jgi:hypothetical protein
MNKPPNIEDLSMFGCFLSAHHFYVYRCDHCPSAHIVLFTEDDTPFAQMTIGPPQLAFINQVCDEIF